MRIRAVGSFCGNNAWGHGLSSSVAVHVFSRSPVRPCTKTMLDVDARLVGGFLIQKVKKPLGETHSIVTRSGLCNCLMPHGKVFRGGVVVADSGLRLRRRTRRSMSGISFFVVLLYGHRGVFICM